MNGFAWPRLTDGNLLRAFKAHIAHDHTSFAVLLSQIAEIDARQLHRPEGFPTMRDYCMHELNLTEHAAYKRIRAARAAWRFPAIFNAVAAGQLNLNAVVLLASHLTPETAEELLADAANKSRGEIERLLAERFPRPDVPTRTQAIAPPPSPLPIDSLAARPVESPAPRPKVAPLSAQKFMLQLTMGQSLHDKLRLAQELLSHQLPSGDIAAVLERGLDALIGKLQKRKCGATDRPRANRSRSTASGRYVPAAVRHAVWERDGGQCTFVSDAGQRCPARTLVELDHIIPVARGGQSTVENLHLTCRAHNQFEAERAFGAEFMQNKREETRRAAAAARAAREANKAAKARAAEEQRVAKEARQAAETEAAAARVAREAHDEAAVAAEQAKLRDVTLCLRELGFRADDVKRGTTLCASMPDTPVAERVRAALRHLTPAHLLPRRPKEFGAAP